MLCCPQLIRFSASPRSPGRTSLLYCTGHIKLITLINHLLQGGTGEPPRGQCTIDELEALLMCSLCEALAFVTAKHLSRRIPFRSPASGSPANAAAAAAAAGDGGESMLAAAVVTKRRAPQRAEPGRRRAVRVFTPSCPRGPRNDKNPSPPPRSWVRQARGRHCIQANRTRGLGSREENPKMETVTITIMMGCLPAQSGTSTTAMNID